MSLASEYLKEREGIETHEKKHGFATYKIIGKECYIIDIYVRPKQRKSGLATSLANDIVKIALRLECTHLTGSIDTRLSSSTASAAVLFSYGFKLLRNDGPMTYFVKEISNG